MKVCVLQPDYSTTHVDYKNYDPPRHLSHLIPGDQVDHIFLNKLTTYSQLAILKKAGYDIFVNLCEGYPEWDVPSVDVIHSLEMLNLPYTGPDTRLYHPSKPLMKYVAYTAGIATPAFQIIETHDDLHAAGRLLTYPLFLKPAHLGDSLGVDEHSLVNGHEQLFVKGEALLGEYGGVLAEEFIDGREYTVLVAADPDESKPCIVYDAIEFVFPEGKNFKTYALKTSELHPDNNVPCGDVSLNEELKKASQKIFEAFNGVGYARLDYRVDKEGRIFFLEINFTCSVFYDNGFEGSADHILLQSPGGKAGFLRNIINEGIRRHRKKQKKFNVRMNAIAGYGIYADDNINAGEILFYGEENAKEIVTSRHVEQKWSPSQKDTFRRYAYPLSSEVFCLWSRNPVDWAPQNHCCSPNTAFHGLDVIAIRDVRKGEELTIDYASFLDETMEPFTCQCGASNCRKFIEGRNGNSVTLREKEMK